MNKKSVKAIVRPLHKTHPPPRLVYDRNESISLEKETNSILYDIQKKVNDSLVLTTKVDTLLFKVEKIEEEQGKISKTVGTIHNAIYDPDNGLFSRISSVKVSQSEERAEIEKQFIELNAWKGQTEKSVTQNKSEDKEFQLALNQNQNALKLNTLFGNHHYQALLANMKEPEQTGFCLYQHNPWQIFTANEISFTPIAKPSNHLNFFEKTIALVKKPYKIPLIMKNKETS